MSVGVYRKRSRVAERVPPRSRRRDAGISSAAPLFSTPDDVPGVILSLDHRAWAGNADGDAIASWANPGAAGAATQSTAGRKPTVKKAAVTTFPKDVVRFDGGDGLATAAYQASPATGQLAIWTCSRRGATGTGQILVVTGTALPSAVTDGIQHYYSGNPAKIEGFQKGDVGSEQIRTAITVASSATAFHLTATYHDKTLPGYEVSCQLDDYQQSQLVSGNQVNNTNGYLVTARELEIGATDPLGTIGNQLTGDIACVVLADTQNWLTNYGYYVHKVENYIRTNYLGLTAYDLNLVFDGDSRTIGMGTVLATEDPPYRVKTRISSKTPRYTNAGISGQTVATMRTRGAASIDRWLVKHTPSVKNVLVLWGGVNDVNAGTSAATTFASILGYCTDRKTAGWDKVIVCTEIAANNATSIAHSYMTAMATINTSIRNQASPPWDAIADLGADTHFDEATDCADATYYNADQIHPAAAGADLVASYIYTALTTLGLGIS